MAFNAMYRESNSCMQIDRHIDTNPYKFKRDDEFISKPNRRFRCFGTSRTAGSIGA